MTGKQLCVVVVSEPANMPSVGQGPPPNERAWCMSTSVKVQAPDVILPPRPPPEDPERDDPNEPDHKPPPIPPPVLNRSWDQRGSSHAAPQVPVTPAWAQAWFARPARQLAATSVRMHPV